MSSERVESESEVSGTQVTIPAHIRDELDIDDGDRLRWHVANDGTLRVEVIQQRHGTFSDFEGYGGEAKTDVDADHDAWSRS